MRVIFLDIDGVLNTTACHEDGQALIDRGCVGRLNILVKRTGAVLVVSSTWRQLVYDGEMTLDGFRWLLRSHGVEAQVVGLTCPDEEEMLRGGQIFRWLREHSETEGFVVLDDDIVSMKKFAGHVLYTNAACGLTDEDVERATQILNRAVSQ